MANFDPRTWFGGGQQQRQGAWNPGFQGPPRGADRQDHLYHMMHSFIDMMGQSAVNTNAQLGHLANVLAQGQGQGGGDHHSGFRQLKLKK